MDTRGFARVGLIGGIRAFGIEAITHRSHITLIEVADTFNRYISDILDILDAKHNTILLGMNDRGGIRHSLQENPEGFTKITRDLILAVRTFKLFGATQFNVECTCPQDVQVLEVYSSVI